MRVVALGECMLELNQGSGITDIRMAFGGDTLNTAIYLQRVGCEVSYVTAVGTDPFSDWLLAAWQREGIDVAAVARLSDRLPGLYAIQTDEQGERQFFYWRKQSAATQMFRQPDGVNLEEALEGADVLYFSGISWSILDVAGRQQLLQQVAACKAKGMRVAFDPNYRPQGWPDKQSAQHELRRLWPIIDVIMPTFDDEKLLWGDLHVEHTLARYQEAQIPEIVVKQGADGATLFEQGKTQHIAVPAVITPIDTTAAGDAFNAAYIASRLRGGCAKQAVVSGHELAGLVIQHKGAIIPLDYSTP